MSGEITMKSFAGRSSGMPRYLTEDFVTYYGTWIFYSNGEGNFWFTDLPCSDCVCKICRVSSSAIKFEHLLKGIQNLRNHVLDFYLRVSVPTTLQITLYEMYTEFKLIKTYSPVVGKWVRNIIPVESFVPDTSLGKLSRYYRTKIASKINKIQFYFSGHTETITVEIGCYTIRRL